MSPPRYAILASALVLGALFMALGIAVSRGATMPIDIALRADVHALASPALTRAAIVASVIGGIVVVTTYTVAMIAVLWAAGDRRASVRLAAAMAAALAIDLATKYGFGRARPEPFFGVSPESYSFPSGHALFSLALCAALLRESPGRFGVPRANGFGWMCGLVLVGGIGLSRIYLGVHYPSDVLGGYLAGAFAVAAAGAAIDHTRFA